MTDTLTITNPIPTTNGGESGGAGTAGGIFIINVIQGETEDQLTLDKTWNEIKTAVDNGMLPIMKIVTEGDGHFSYRLSMASAVVSTEVTEGSVIYYVSDSGSGGLGEFGSADPDGVLTGNQK